MRKAMRSQARHRSRDHRRPAAFDGYRRRMALAALPYLAIFLCLVAFWAAVDIAARAVLSIL
jgi:hypothetical protein